MRKIKFRAWDKSQKYMAYQGMPDLETLQSFIFHFGDKELMQFVGLKDCNGQEIYEGDIVEEGIVIFSKYYYGYFIKTDNDELPLYDNLPVQIIGNIHENPNILESEK